METSKPIGISTDSYPPSSSVAELRVKFEFSLFWNHSRFNVTSKGQICDIKELIFQVKWELDDA